MAGYDVSVSMGMVDNVSRTLKTINDKIEKVLITADKYNDTIGKLTDNFGIMKTHTGKLADDLERMARAYKDLKGYGVIKVPTASGSTSLIDTSSDRAVNSMRSDSGYGTDALRGSASDVESLTKRLKELPQAMDYGFIGVSERIDRVVRDLRLAYQTGEQFTDVLRKMNIPTMGTGLSSAMMQAQSSYTRQLHSLEAMQENMARTGKLSVEEMTNAYRGLTSVLKDAKNVHMQMTNVITSGGLSDDQVEELNVEYQKYINNVKSVIQAVTYLGDATDVALDSPELKQAIQDYDKLEKEIREAAEAKARLKAEDKAMGEILKGQERAQKAIRDRIKAEEDAARRSVQAEKQAAKEREAIIKRLTKQGEENQKRLNKQAEQSVARIRATNNELSKTNSIARNASSGIDSLTSSIKNLAAGYLSLQGAQAVLNTSDSLILTEGKLSNMTDNVEGLMDDIYQMSQDTRTAYLDNASQMAKMWQLTGGTEGIFDSEEKLLQFNEILNKGFILGGSGTREINASLYQLTQALSSGRLQGDELRSLAENAPYLINAVTNSLEDMYNEGKAQSEWIDLTYKDLKELGAEGALTSDLVVAAVLNSTDEIRKAYENLTPTFEQVFQTLKNQAIKISEPVLKKLNEIINSEAFEKTAQAIMKMLAVVVAALGPVVEAILWIGELIADNWGIVEPIIWGIVGALVAYYSYLGLIKIATIAIGIASKAMAAVQLIFKGLTMMAILYRVAVGKATLTQAKMSAAVLFGAQADAIKTKTGLGSAIAEWKRVKAMWASTNAAWKNATATGVSTGATAGATLATTGLTGATWGFVTAEYAALLPILLVVAAIVLTIAVIYLAVKAWNHYKDDTLTMLGAIAGGVAWLAGWIVNAFIFIYNMAIIAMKYIAAGLVALGAGAHNIVMGIVNIFLKAAGVIVGTLMAAWAIIYNGGVGLWNGLVEVAEAIANAFIWMKNVIHNALATLFGWIIDGINGILGGLNSLVDGYNSVAGALGGSEISGFGTIENTWEIVDTSEGFVDYSDKKLEYKDISAEFNEGLHMFDGYLQEYADMGQTFDETFDKLSGMDSWQADYVDPNEWFDAGRNLGDNTTDKVGDWWDSLKEDMDYTKYMEDIEGETADIEKLMEGLGDTAEDAVDKSKAGDNYANSKPNYKGSNLGGGGLTPDQEAALGGVEDNTGSIADSVSTTDKELELLRELAERRAINRFTTAEVRITNNMTNNINSELDMDGVVNYLTEELNRSLVAGSEAANHY